MSADPDSSLPGLFAFEDGDYAELQWIPLGLRFKLDRCGLHLTLSSWRKMPMAERASLLERPCDREEDRLSWAARLKIAAAASGGEMPAKMDPWSDPPDPPEAVKTRLAGLKLNLPTAAWRKLRPLHRYALCKLAESKSADKFFPLAAKEFGL